MTLGAASSRVDGLDPGRDMHRLDGGDRRHADARAPGQKFLGGAVIGPARVRVADVGGEEFEEAHRGALAGGGDQRRCVRMTKGNKFVHFFFTFEALARAS